MDDHPACRQDAPWAGLVGQAWSRRERSWETPSSSVGSPPSFTLIDDRHSRITQTHHVRAQVVLRVMSDVLYTNAAASLVPGAEAEAPPKEEPADSKLQLKSRLLFTGCLACWLQPPLSGFYVNCQGGSNASLKPSLMVMVAGKWKKPWRVVTARIHMAVVVAWDFLFVHLKVQALFYWWILGWFCSR